MLLEISREPARFLTPYKTGASTQDDRSRNRALGSQPQPSGCDLTTSRVFGPFSQFGQTGISGAPAWGNLDRVSQNDRGQMRAGFAG